MFQISTLFGTSLTLVKTVPNIRGYGVRLEQFYWIKVYKFLFKHLDDYTNLTPPFLSCFFSWHVFSWS